MGASPPTSASPALSRRDLLASTGRLALFALAGGIPTLAACSTAPATSGPLSDPELARLVDGVIGVDMHSHSGGVHFRSRPGVDLAQQLRHGRMTAVCLCHTGDGPVIRRDADNRVVTSRSPAPGELWRHTLNRLDFIEAMVRAQGLRRVLKTGDLEAANRGRAPAIVQGIEGCQFLEGKVERVADVYRRGVRQLQLVHFFKSELGDNQTESPEQGGLTALGREVIAECNRLGIVVDTAHGTPKLVEQAAQACRTPLLLSHTAVTRRPAPFSRLISREHGLAIAGTGGVVGIWALAPTFETLSAFVDGIARAVDAIGVDHVGLGSDVGGAGRNVWPDYADFPAVVGLLRQKGFSAEEIGKLVGGNYVRVFNASVRS